MAKKVVTNDGKKGGWLVGKRHYDKKGKSLGGIKAVVTDAGGKPVELEGGEVIINREASKKYWKELSRINQSAGNGVPIEPPSDAFDEDPSEDYENGGKIEFNANHIPNKWILNYAIKIKEEHPDVWALGGNIFGNQAFINLKRVAERGHWLDSEEWMYKKWRSFVARHKGDFRIQGVIAMLKWVDKVDKGWQYMKNLIEEEIKKREARKSKKMNDGGNLSKTPAPKSERIKGSKTNPKGTAKDSKSGASIKFDENTLASIKSLIDSHNEKYPSKKITLGVAKAVVRRGMGAYSSTHRPTITGGKPNSRTAWGLARLKAFIHKAEKGKSKSGKYSQDNDLFDDLDIKVSKFATGGLIAPNGKPSNLTSEQYKLVRTPEFKAWFGDWENDPKNASKVIDENGEPKVMYRGNPQEQVDLGHTFNLGYNFLNKKTKNNFGFFFTDNLDIAHRYMKVSKWGEIQGGSVTQVFLNIKNLFDLTPLDLFTDGETFSNYLVSSGLKTKGYKELIKRISEYRYYEHKEQANVYGFFDKFPSLNTFFIYNKIDGIVFKEMSRAKFPYSTYVVFNSNQIKLADGSNTTFDGKNSDIRYDDGGNINLGKVSSASSRFRPSETIVFDPPLLGPNGNKLISYTWKYEWTTDFSIRTGDAIEKRVSDWSQAELSADTGRNIVHSFTIVKPNGESLSVSSESVPIVMGFVSKEQKKDFSNLATASKTLAKQQMQLSILEAQQKEFEEIKQSIIDAGYPEIEIKPWYSDDQVKLVMGDGSAVADANNPYEKERIEVLKESYVRGELAKLGIDWYRSNNSFQISELKKRIERQKRKVENITETSKMEDGGNVDAKDSVTIDIPLMIRLLELSREDIKSDAELHFVVENLLKLKNKPVLTMDDYAFIADVEHNHLKKYDLGGKMPEGERTVDLGFGGLGNGTTVWDRNRIHNNDYKIVAHISNEGKITYYDKKLPEYAINQIESMAENDKKRYEDMNGLSTGYDFNPIQTPLN